MQKEDFNFGDTVYVNGSQRAFIFIEKDHFYDPIEKRTFREPNAFISSYCFSIINDLQKASDCLRSSNLRVMMLQVERGIGTTTAINQLKRAGDFVIDRNCHWQDAVGRNLDFVWIDAGNLKDAEKKFDFIKDLVRPSTKVLVVYSK